MPEADLDFFADLDAALAQVTTKTKLEARQKKLKGKLQTAMIHRANEGARKLIRADLDAINIQLEQVQWAVVSNIAMFQETTCRSCGSKTTVFVQFMERLKANFGPKTNRMSRIPKPHPGVANEIVISPVEGDICVACCDRSGFGDEVSITRLSLAPRDY